MIQIDMPMPKNCLDCPACNEYLMCAIPANGRGWGENDVKDFSQGRPDWCPMKEQKAVVRCKDCKHRTRRVCNNIELWECNHIRYELAKCGVTDDWFCADGERKEGDGDGT